MQGYQGLLTLEVGVPGKLLLAGEVAEVLPLENQEALEAAGPIQTEKGIQFDPEKLLTRRQAMVAHLPEKGLALVVLGGSHDLGPHLNPQTLYVRVTPRSYPE
jgi:hypothetical protein